MDMNVVFIDRYEKEIPDMSDLIVDNEEDSGEIILEKLAESGLEFVRSFARKGRFYVVAQAIHCHYCRTGGIRNWLNSNNIWVCQKCEVKYP